MFQDYAEVRNDYLDESDGFYRIDTWKTSDDRSRNANLVPPKSSGVSEGLRSI